MSSSRRSLCHGDGSVFGWLTVFLSDHLYSTFHNLQRQLFVIRFEGLTTMLMKGTFLWDITACSQLKVNRRF
jgi:hypothetical protein